MAWVNIIDLFYPVGTIYTTNDSTNNPADLFGGTWVQVSATAPYTWRRTAKKKKKNNINSWKNIFYRV